MLKWPHERDLKFYLQILAVLEDKNPLLYLLGTIEFRTVTCWLCCHLDNTSRNFKQLTTSALASLSCHIIRGSFHLFTPSLRANEQYKTRSKPSYWKLGKCIGFLVGIFTSSSNLSFVSITDSDN